MKKYTYEGFNDTKYLMRAKVLTIMNAWTIFDSKKNEVFYCKQKPSFKTDIHIYTGKSKEREVLIAKTNSIIDFSAHYDITDPETREKIGAAKRKGMKSLLRDEWIIMDKNNIEIGKVKEDNTVMALIRRFLPAWLVPKRYSLFIGEAQVGLFKKHRNPFVWKTSIDFSQDIENLLDRRMGIAIALLLCGIGEREN